MMNTERLYEAAEMLYGRLLKQGTSVLSSEIKYLDPYSIPAHTRRFVFEWLVKEVQRESLLQGKEVSGDASGEGTVGAI